MGDWLIFGALFREEHPGCMLWLAAALVVAGLTMIVKGLVAHG